MDTSHLEVDSESSWDSLSSQEIPSPAGRLVPRSWKAGGSGLQAQEGGGQWRAGAKGFPTALTLVLNTQLSRKQVVFSCSSHRQGHGWTGWDAVPRATVRTGLQML